jgi:hypothetical protein
VPGSAARGSDLPRQADRIYDYKESILRRLERAGLVEAVRPTRRRRLDYPTAEHLTLGPVSLPLKWRLTSTTDSSTRANVTELLAVQPSSVRSTSWRILSDRDPNGIAVRSEVARYLTQAGLGL